MSSEKNKFKLNLSGLLKVLAEHLYSSRKVALRELIQNAHDSVVRREMENSSQHNSPRINITSDPISRTFTIEDNGAGMTEEEILTYLATIGNSYTRELGQELAFRSPETASKLIGQFGLGFLSAFLIAEKVSLVTRSFKSDQAYLWVADGSEHFVLQPIDHDTIGTKITIKVKPEVQYILRESTLHETIRNYADFLSVPIYLNGGSLPINLMNPPWASIDPQQAMKDYIQNTFSHQDIITIIPLHDEVIDLGHDSLEIPMSGFVFIPNNSVVSLREYGDLRVYIRGMFITEEERHLLPSWARFMRGIIDCTALQPTASRESLHQEDNYLAVQQALEKQLLSALRKIANEEPKTWRKIVTGHTDLVLGWIVANNEFFEQVADKLLLRTSRGLMDVTTYLQQTQNIFYFTTHEIGSLQEQVLGEGYEVPVIDASWFGVRGFLDKYASWRTGIQLIQMDGDARQLLRPVAESPYSYLLNHYRKKGILVKIVSFKPESVPAIILFPRNADAIRQAKDALDSGDLSLPFVAMVNDYLEQQTKNDASMNEAEQGMLYLNANSPIIKDLVDRSSSQTEIILDLLYQIARLFAGRYLSPSDANHVFQDLTKSVQELMKHE